MSLTKMIKYKDSDNSTKMLVMGSLAHRSKILNLSSVEFRTIFQKGIYFLQECGINLGYVFEWHPCGPYSKKLTYDGLRIQKIISSSKITEPLITLNENDQERYHKFSQLLHSLDYDPTNLEIAASIHYLMHYVKLQKRHAFLDIRGKKLSFTHERCNKVLMTLDAYDMS